MSATIVFVKREGSTDRTFTESSSEVFRFFGSTLEERTMSVVQVLDVQARQGVDAGDYGIIPANRQYLYCKYDLDQAALDSEFSITVRSFVSSDNGANWNAILGSIVTIGPGPYDGIQPETQINITGLAGQRLRQEMSVPDEMVCGCRISDEPWEE